MIRDVGAADLPRLHALNQQAVPAVNGLDPEAFAAVVALAPWRRVACRDGTVIGFLLAFLPGSSYASENYRWFMGRGGRFVYIDRIVVAAEARGVGVGRALYDDLAASALAAHAPLVCEVNLRPPNPESLAFHQRLGFREVGRQDTEGGAKTVALLERGMPRRS